MRHIVKEQEMLVKSREEIDKENQMLKTETNQLKNEIEEIKKTIYTEKDRTMDKGLELKNKPNILMFNRRIQRTLFQCSRRYR